MATKTQQKRDLDTIGASACAAIEEMVEALHAVDGDEDVDDDAREKAQEAIQQDPLSIEVGGFWTPGTENPEATEYRVLLATGGPAVRIVGSLWTLWPARYSNVAGARLVYTVD